MWCLRGYYFKMAPGTVKKAIRSFADRVRSYKLCRFPPISELRNEPKKDLNTNNKSN